MRIISIACVLVMAFLSSAHADAAKENTLCHQDEQVFFSCRTSDKDRIVSLCGSKDFDKASGYLQYRFGTLANVEMQYPEDAQKSQALLHYGHYFRAQVDRSRIYFSKGAYSYSVFSDYEGDMKPKTSSTGVEVTNTANNKDVTYSCSGDAVNKIAKLQTVLSCDPDEVDCAGGGLGHPAKP